MNKLLPLFAYFNVFEEGKLRPGFVIQNKLFVLTSQPRLNVVATQKVWGDHFQTVRYSYLTQVGLQNIPPPYNNVCSGFLPLTDDVVQYLVHQTGLKPSEINSYFL